MDPRLILAADGSEESLIVLHQVLVHLGHSVVLASNADEAVAQAARHRPDAILLDMEAMAPDPRQILRALAVEGWAATTPVIGLAACRDRSEANDRLAGVIRKPIVLSSLAAVLERCLAAPSTSAQDGGALFAYSAPG